MNSEWQCSQYLDLNPTCVTTDRTKVTENNLNTTSKVNQILVAQYSIMTNKANCGAKWVVRLALILTYNAKE